MTEYESTNGIQVSNEEKNHGILIHVLGLIIGIIAPIIFLFVNKESEYVKAHIYSALNYHITLYIYTFIAGILCFVFIGFLLLPIIGLFYMVGMIIAIVKATEMKVYDIPLTIKLIK